jgi:mRNA interferase RelE/StbE
LKTVLYSREALKVLGRIPVNVATRIRAKIVQYAAEPGSLSKNVVRLQGSAYFRLRVGDWRVIFDDQGKVLLIVQVGPRGGVYG